MMYKKTLLFIFTIAILVHSACMTACPPKPFCHSKKGCFTKLEDRNFNVVWGACDGCPGKQGACVELADNPDQCLTSEVTTCPGNLYQLDNCEKVTAAVDPKARGVQTYKPCGTEPCCVGSWPFYPAENP